MNQEVQKTPRHPAGRGHTNLVGRDEDQHGESEGGGGGGERERERGGGGT